MFNKLISSVVLLGSVCSLGCGPGEVGETCDPLPSGDGILTCRYTNSFGDACTDFDTNTTAWDVASVTAFCEASSNEGIATVVVSDDDSCLLATGVLPDAGICQSEDATFGTFYPYLPGAPVFVCTGATYSGTPVASPLCSGY